MPELSPTDWLREQTERILQQGTTVGVGDGPVVLFTVTGPKSAKKRYVPLMRVEDGDEVATGDRVRSTVRSVSTGGNWRSRRFLSSLVFHGLSASSLERDVVGVERGVSTSWTATSLNPASASIDVASCCPHMLPSPIPPGQRYRHAVHGRNGVKKGGQRYLNVLLEMA